MTGRVAAYDEHADWYEAYMTQEGGREYTDRVAGMLSDLLRPGTGICLDVCGGTGVRAATIAAAGWRPLNIDISTGQLRHAMRRESVVDGDAAALPIKSESVDAVVSVLAHTDVDDYPAVVREIARTLRPGGQFVHIGIHPCFCGYFADWSDRTRVVLIPGYNERVHSYEAWTPHGVRARVGAWHLTLADLVNAIVDAGLVVRRLSEDGPEELPDLLGIAAAKPV